MNKVNLLDALDQVDEYWSPRIVGQANDQFIKVAKLKGEFVWHQHDDTDETFIVIDGRVRIEFRDGEVELDPGEMYVVPRGIEHRPRADDEAKLLVIEPRGVVNTGEAGGERGGF